MRLGRRPLRTLGGGLLAAAALAVGAAPAPACGCGAMIPREGRAGPVGEWSLVGFDGRAETILMRLSLGTPLDQAALVLPVRPGTSVTLGDDDAFDRVASLTAPRVEHRTRYHLGFDHHENNTADGVGAGAGARAPGVQVLGSQRLGPLRVVTLRSRSAGALEAYLRRNHFPLPDGLAASTQAYLDGGWDVVVAKLRPAAAGRPLTSLQPLAIRFATDHPVYPLRLSRLAEAGTSARVDVLAPWKVAVGGYGTVAREVPDEVTTGPGVALVFAGRIDAGALGSALGHAGSYLTSYRFRVTPDSPDHDPAFVRATDQDGYRQVRLEYDDVYLGGWVAGGVALVAFVSVAVVWLRRRRRAP